ncbi:Efflux pump membrane transporter BepE [Posidoniimonas corsicana]|uniref:Efflux pump membrane transporter BepE n=1 Tax=Posidoniimonas corsicana TaxID=1938618 RepID=A0A5C5UYA5_9BACT|nr:multidrug efflux RND transporter permease subunit [Posidoniimonas corsicana]TWT30435.1 Efflux pump membrane transporter BepE [Posidoniimonas corsicana]
MSRFFIHRPIFASVISIVIVLAGAVAQRGLPISKFPEISPPTVQVSCSYPGASAKVVAETVAAPIEQEVNGVEDMLYLSSVSSDDGSYKLTVTFEIGVDLDMATVLVQNRVAIAEPKLPEDVRRQGITTKKQSTQILQFITLTSPDGSTSDLDLSNYATRFIKDELARIDGVGSVEILGADEYSMRVWLDPHKLKARQLTTEDVVNAIREQNVQVAAGRIGEPPAPKGTAFQYSVNTLGRLRDVEQFGNIIIKTADGVRFTRVRDVARVELGSKSYSVSSKFNGAPSTNIAIYQLPGANALDIAARVHETMAKLAKNFPPGIAYEIPFDTTKFVEASIEEVYSTLFVAVLLVVLVIFVFLQDWRATLIPCAAIPVALIGAFGVMAAIGFSINMLTLFGVVLAIGIVVDDSIVVVENTARWLDEGLPPKQAAERAMEEMTGPVIATTLVLLAVFVPTAFMGGITGQLYKQFALTISAAVVLSSVNALSLSPALCGILMRPTQEVRNPFFKLFNKGFDSVASVYKSVIGGTVRVVPLTLLIFVGLVAVTGLGFARLPTGFMPTEDQGYAFANVQLPDSASLQRTEEVIARVDRVLANTPGVRDRVLVSGYSMLSGSRGSNSGMAAIVFEPWGDRTAEQTAQDAIVENLRREFSEIEEAIAIAFVPPPIDGLGNASGFQMQLLDQGDVGLVELQNSANNLIAAGRGQSNLNARSLNTTFRAGVPQLFADVDRDKVKSQNIPLSSVFGTLQAYLGSAYVNDFNRFGRTYQVRVQAAEQFRASPDDIAMLDVRNAAGQMSPLGSLLTVNHSLGPQLVTRYNLYPTAQINGEPAAGVSSGQALSLMEQMADQSLPPGVGYAWTGMSYQEKQTGNEQYFIFALAIVFVFLVLAAQYESWVQPAAVIAVVPLAALGVVVMLMARGMDNNTYTQIGVVLLVALASKNAILIVEFAAEQRKKGLSLREAAVSAAELRFRAILMTAFSSILGFLPLLVSSGAGAASRQAVGNAVVGGMIAATISSLLFVPTFFVVFRGLGEWAAGKPADRPV